MKIALKIYLNVNFEGFHMIDGRIQRYFHTLLIEGSLTGLFQGRLPYLILCHF